MGKIRLTQFMPKVWEKLQTCVQHRRGGKLGRKKSELWLGKGVVNNPSKAWDIWYAVQCERSKSGNQLGWRESSMDRCWRCRFQSHLHHPCCSIMAESSIERDPYSLRCGSNGRSRFTHIFSNSGPLFCNLSGPKR